MTFDELRAIALLDGLSDDQVRALADAGEEVTFQPGDELFRSGQPADYWWLLLEGRVDLIRHVGHEDTVLGTMSNPGQWAGGFRAWDPNGVYMATGRATVGGRYLRVPAERLGEKAQEWFPFGVHMIKGLMQTVRTIEQTARQREALVALGTLAAGLAHEINNPASAATRAADALRETTIQLKDALLALAEAGLTAEQYVALDTLRSELRVTHLADDPLALADREDELTDWLAGHGVAEDWLIAPALAAAGADVPWCEKVAGLLHGPCLDPALHWVSSSLSMAALLAEVKESTQRVSALVGAARSYSQLDRASIQRTDIVEGLQSTLMVLANRLKGVTVVRDLGEVPEIEAYAGELNQVWTNLINNGIDAMDGADGTATLRVSCHAVERDIVVEIADSGPGIPPDVLPHVFEPFFTTKDVGHGTGLGLDISRRIIVERHAGDISIDRVDGQTVFRVTLPGPRR